MKSRTNTEVAMEELLIARGQRNTRRTIGATV